MPTKWIDAKGRVEAVLVARDPSSMVSTPVKKIKVFLRHGVHGDVHAGGRVADVREQAFLSHGLHKGAETLNMREFSAVSLEENSAIASDLGLPSMPFGVLGVNLAISGIKNFSKLLCPGTLLFFRGGNQTRTAVLAVWEDNLPCIVAAQAVQQVFPRAPDVERLFVKTAMGRRGIVGAVFCSGVIGEGDEVTAKIPVA